MDFGQSFLRGIAGAYDLEDAAVERLGPALHTHLADAKTRWPGVVVSGEDYAEHLARCAPDVEDPIDALASMHTADLYLAYACTAGVREAIVAFESKVMSEVPRAVARIDRDDAFIGQVMEDVRIKLLVGDGREPRIGSYLGRGPLTSWVQVTAIRTAYGLKRRSEKEVPTPDEALDLPLLSEDPELVALRAQVREPFRRAFRAALGGLSPRDRNVLRLYLVEEVSAETIGTMYGVHRATVARWIAAARRSVHKATRTTLAAELELSPTSFESLMAKVLTGLDISLSSFLGSAS